MAAERYDLQHLSNIFRCLFIDALDPTHCITTMAWTLPSTYREYRRQRLVHGPSPPTSVAAPSSSAELAPFKQQAVALEKMLLAEAQDARAEACRLAKHAAGLVERKLEMRRAAARTLQRWIRRHVLRHRAARQLAVWWQRQHRQNRSSWRLPTTDNTSSREVSCTEKAPPQAVTSPASSTGAYRTTDRPLRDCHQSPRMIKQPLSSVPTSRQDDPLISLDGEPPIQRTSPRQSVETSGSQDVRLTVPSGLVVELLALRGLGLPSSSHALTAEVQFLHHATVRATLQSTTLDAHESALEWTVENVLSLAEAPLALAEWRCRVQVFRHDAQDKVKCIGQVNVPADLLESPLAHEYALTRWFPLEKTVPGELVRGDLRIAFQYKVAQEASTQPSPPRQESTSTSTSTTEGPSPSKLAKLKARQKPQTSNSRGADETRGSTRSISALASPTQSRSPPRSNNQPPAPPTTAAAADDDSDVPKHPYLKRKPYQVKFERLDWSGVSSKTDSNMATKTPPPSVPPPPPPTTTTGSSSSSLEQLLSLHGTNQMKLELMHLKQKSELHTIFHHPVLHPPSVIPSLTRAHLVKLQHVPVGHTTTQLQATYASLKVALQESSLDV
ncbi:Aste57867_20826 [Aphanomyces stellatus]|uniref:Aste57867_20826 protein n=1 Tax=Aphanomyces stellatus TaxID=120398 RepID=A0A485LFW8_9STRA|nr:hypothetical protein As57867_020758 [Aphanomyces stellatus]VFT97505.1 Aste57867_20826 [Aphanomyces stellatus]